MPGAREGKVPAVTDHFTQYAQACITGSQIALTESKVLWDNFIIHYGLPEKILSDQGRNFESELIINLCKLTGTTKLSSSPYHPETNGQCKRFNSTLIKILGMLPPECKFDWKGSIGMLVHVYYCTHNYAMGFSPYFLMYGRQPLLLVDVTHGISPNPIATFTSSKYIQKLRDCIKWAHKKADLFQQKEVQCHKQASLCLCYGLQGQAQNSEQMGEQGVCGGMAALPEPTSVCGTSHRWGRVQPHPTQKPPVAN